MLDTNICIYLMKNHPLSVAKRFAACRQGDVVISAITMAELEYGVYCCKAETRDRNRQALDELLPLIPAVSFDRGSAIAYAKICAPAPDRKRDALDKLIASHASSLNLTLVTNNISDFSVYPDLSLENWTEEP
ncbi:type II toxin-antitoxin system VapC family toxin [Altericista sp. CCNU0014]|uniref:type II toxin-antitoxin system VapC family toxin n=1 Tax=Altericista sp. CCNU0014 TaxID=3082949 RepID=UPI00384FACB2